MVPTRSDLVRIAYPSLLCPEKNTAVLLFSYWYPWQSDLLRTQFGAA